MKILEKQKQESNNGFFIRYILVLNLFKTFRKCLWRTTRIFDNQRRVNYRIRTKTKTAT